MEKFSVLFSFWATVTDCNKLTSTQGLHLSYRPALLKHKLHYFDMATSPTTSYTRHLHMSKCCDLFPQPFDFYGFLVQFVVELLYTFHLLRIVVELVVQRICNNQVSGVWTVNARSGSSWSSWISASKETNSVYQCRHITEHRTTWSPDMWTYSRRGTNVVKNSIITPKLVEV